MACTQMNTQDQKNYHPVCIFGYKRSDKLKNCIDALLKCTGAQFTNVHIFLDGPKNEHERNEVTRVYDIAKLYEKAGFASLEIKRQKSNMGLANSVILGVPLLTLVSRLMLSNTLIIICLIGEAGLFLIYSLRSKLPILHKM